MPHLFSLLKLGNKKPCFASNILFTPPLSSTATVFFYVHPSLIDYHQHNHPHHHHRHHHHHHDQITAWWVSSVCYLSVCSLIIINIVTITNIITIVIIITTRMVLGEFLVSATWASANWLSSTPSPSPTSSPLASSSPPEYCLGRVSSVCYLSVCTLITITIVISITIINVIIIIIIIIIMIIAPGICLSSSSATSLGKWDTPSRIIGTHCAHISTHNLYTCRIHNTREISNTQFIYTVHT